MKRTHACVALGSLLVGLAGCAHEDGTRKRTTISAVTNEEMTGDPSEQGKTRMRYTVVDDEEARNREEVRAELAERSAGRAQRARRTASLESGIGVQEASLREAQENDRAAPMLGTQPLPNIEPQAAAPRAEAKANVREEPSAAPPCERTVFFAAKSAELDWTAQQQLKHVAACIKAGKVEEAMILGRLNPQQGSRFQRRLAKERALAISEYLRQLGVDEANIHVRSRGQLSDKDREALEAGARRATVTIQ